MATRWVEAGTCPHCGGSLRRRVTRQPGVADEVWVRSGPPVCRKGCVVSAEELAEDR